MGQTYNVYRNGDLIAEGLTQKSYEDTGLDSDTTYEYKVTTVGEWGGESEPATLEVTTESEDDEEED
ncbi:hypothetical protein BpsS140_00021 [Bacillus phage vB_BpsS-140]|nr:hypothetical protein BpsS140_00021 [Bacillus phage vB_BpsS-140]